MIKQNKLKPFYLVSMYLKVKFMGLFFLVLFRKYKMLNRMLKKLQAINVMLVPKHCVLMSCSIILTDIFFDEVLGPLKMDWPIIIKYLCFTPANQLLIFQTLITFALYKELSNSLKFIFIITAIAYRKNVHSTKIFYSTITDRRDPIISSTFTNITNLSNTIITADVNAHSSSWVLAYQRL